MKKFIFFIISLFLFVPSVNALHINNVDIKVKVDENGTATVKETWVIPKQIDQRVITRTFAVPEDVKITNIKINDLKNY